MLKIRCPNPACDFAGQSLDQTSMVVMIQAGLSLLTSNVLISSA